MADTDSTSSDKYVSLRDFKYTTLTGTTASSANTAAKFRHGINQVPVYWIAVEGSVYVPRNGMDQNNIDLRSTRTSEQFKVLVFY